MQSNHRNRDCSFSTTGGHQDAQVIVLLLFLLVGLTAFTVSLSLPKKYSASARIKVEEEKPSVDVFAQTQVQGYNPYFLRTQYQIIQSQKILYPVIESFNCSSSGVCHRPRDEAIEGPAFRPSVSGYVAHRDWGD